MGGAVSNQQVTLDQIAIDYMNSLPEDNPLNKYDAELSKNNLSMLHGDVVLAAYNYLKTIDDTTLQEKHLIDLKNNLLVECTRRNLQV